MICNVAAALLYEGGSMNDDCRNNFFDESYVWDCSIQKSEMTKVRV